MMMFHMRFHCIYRLDSAAPSELAHLGFSGSTLSKDILGIQNPQEINDKGVPLAHDPCPNPPCAAASPPRPPRTRRAAR